MGSGHQEEGAVSEDLYAEGGSSSFMVARESPLGGQSAGVEFEEFYSKNYRTLHAALIVMSRNPYISEEVCQEAFARLLTRWERVKNMRSPRGYLFRTAMNTYRDEMRRLRRSDPLPADLQDPNDPADAVEGRTVLENALLELPPRQRQALVLMEYLGLSSVQSARAMSVRPGTVRRLASLARKNLKVAGNKEDQE